MKKIMLTCLSLIALLCFTSLSFASVDLKGKYTGAQFKRTGNSIALTKNSMYGTEILVINNTPDPIEVEVPYTGISDWLNGNGVYRIVSNLVFPTTNVTIWHPNYGYLDSYVSNYSIISFSIQYGRANIITVEYY